MAEFSYVARDGGGQRVTGTVSATTRREAMAAIAAKSLFPVDVRAAGGMVDVKRVRRVPAQILAMTFGQLADLLRSGVPLLRSLDVLKRQTRNPSMKEVLGRVHHDVEQGASLAEAMGRYPAVFGEMAVNMVRAGGEGGFLEDSLQRVATFTEAQDDLKKRTAGALAYPLMLASIGTIIVTALMIFFVPKFETLFSELRERGELPALTEAVLGLSRFISSWGVVPLGAAVVGGFAIRRWLATDRGRTTFDLIKIKLPLVGGIFLSLASARFCRVLGTLLHNGVPVIRSLEVSSAAAGNRILAVAVRKAGEEISAGQRLAGPLAASGHFPPTIVEMIAIAEESNTLETVLIQIADSLERQTWRRLDLAVRLLEPVMLLVLAGFVMALVLALLMPILKASTTLGT